jgi:hypothetical protein
MGGEVKESMGFADDTWGVVHEMKPHPDELALQEVSEDFFPDDPEGEVAYRLGEDYPVEPSGT